MKVLILEPYYDAFLETFYASRRDVSELNFEEHRRQLFQTRFPCSDAYSYYMKKSGWEAEEIITNDSRLQLKWARENRIGRVVYLPLFLTKGLNRYLGWDWRFKILKAQVRKIKPDIILIHEKNILTDAFLRELKPYVKLLACQTASPNLENRSLKYYDLVITALPSYVSLFRKEGLRVEFQKLCFDSRILSEMKPQPKKYDVVFVGGISKAHHQRLQLLEFLSTQITFDWFGYGLQNLPRSSPLKRCFRGVVWGLEMYRTLAAAKVVLNFHVDVANDQAVNLRLYETTGVGSCLLTDWKSNLHEIFNVDQEVVTYRNPEELVEKARHLLDHDDQRELIAASGQRRTLSEHTYENRIPELMQILKSYLDT